MWVACGVLCAGRMRLFALCFLSLALACGRDVPETFSPGGAASSTRLGPPTTDAGTSGAGCGTVPLGPDCCEAGRRVGSATCIADSWTCGVGSVCTCAGKAQPFLCAEYCGSDAFAAPECINGEWSCARPTMPTSMCRSDTCWGEPGDCCGAPSCVDGGWVCGFTPTGC